MSVAPQALSRVVTNLLDNAFYAVRERTAGAPPPYAPAVVVILPGTV